MSAGSGIRHSEFNHSKTDPVHFLQIWLLPETQGIAPSYEQTHFSQADKRNRLRLIASRDGRDGSLTVHQDAAIYAALLAPAAVVAHPLAPGRKAWLQVARGSVVVNGEHLGAGDGVAIEDEPSLTVTGRGDDAEILLFDLPAA